MNVNKQLIINFLHKKKEFKSKLLNYSKIFYVYIYYSF